MSIKKKVNWSEIGTLRQAEGRNPYLVINPGIKILIGKYNKELEDFSNFKEVELSDYRTVQCVDPVKGIDALLDGGHINEEEHEAKLDFIEEKNVRYKLSVPPIED